MPDFSRLTDIARAHYAERKSGRSFHCCFVLKGGKPITIGFNDYGKSNIVCARYAPHRPHHKQDYCARVHAEISSTGFLRGRDVSGLKIVSVRLKNGELRNAKPCVNCEGVLRSMGFKNVFYSEDSGEFTKMKL